MKDILRENKKGVVFVIVLAVAMAILSLGGAYMIIGGVNPETAMVFALVSILVFYFPNLYIEQ